MAEYINYSADNHIAILQINKIHSLNALNIDLLQELDAKTDTVINDKTIRTAIITGVGKCFVAGADIKAMSVYTKEQALQFAKLGCRVFDKIENADKVFISAINGYAIGGGLELAMSCDLRIASDNAIFSQPEVSLGIIPGFGGTLRLAKLIGLTKAKEMIFSGEKIDSQTALSLGLINKITTQNELMDYCIEFANKLNKNSFAAIINAKKSINEGFMCNTKQGCRNENKYFSSLFQTYSQQEGMQAFIEKRKANFD